MLARLIRELSGVVIHRGHHRHTVFDSERKLLIGQRPINTHTNKREFIILNAGVSALRGYL
jgi:hypothetical protein